MTRLLDARTSQNASYGNTISIPLPANTPVAIAELGLDVTGAGENMRVQLSGIAELSFPTTPPFDSVIAISIVRGTLDSPVAYALYSVSVSRQIPTLCRSSPLMLPITMSLYHHQMNWCIPYIYFAQRMPPE